MSRSKDPTYGKHRPAHVYVSDSISENFWLVIHRQYLNSGYGRTNMIIVSNNPRRVYETIDAEKQSYPINGYGGRYDDPIEFAPGLWVAWCTHSESCE